MPSRESWSSSVDKIFILLLFLLKFPPRMNIVENVLVYLKDQLNDMTAGNPTLLKVATDTVELLVPDL